MLSIYQILELRSIPVPVTIHQSGVQQYFYCPYLYNATSEDDLKPGYFYLGTLMHKLFECRFRGYELDRNLVQHVHDELVTNNNYAEVMPPSHAFEQEA